MHIPPSAPPSSPSGSAPEPTPTRRRSESDRSRTPSAQTSSGSGALTPRTGANEPAQITAEQALPPARRQDLARNAHAHIPVRPRIVVTRQQQYRPDDLQSDLQRFADAPDAADNSPAEPGRPRPAPVPQPRRAAPDEAPLLVDPLTGERAPRSDDGVSSSAWSDVTILPSSERSRHDLEAGSVAGSDAPDSKTATSPAAARGPGLPSRVLGTLEQALKSLDVYEQVTRRDDAKILTTLRAEPEDLESGGSRSASASTSAERAATLPELQQAVTMLQRSFLTALRAEPAAGAAGRTRSLTEAHLNAIRAQLQELSLDQPFLRRASVPFALNSVSAAISLSVAVLLKDPEFTALTAGFFAQTAVKLAGQLRNTSSASPAVFARQLRDRLAIPVIDSALWSPPLLKQLQTAGESTAWVSGAAVASAAAFAGLFFSREITAGANRLFRGHPAPALRSTGATLSIATLQAVADLRSGITRVGTSLSRSIEELEASGLHTSESLASQIALLGDSIAAMSGDLGHLLSPVGGEQAGLSSDATLSPARSPEDQRRKWVLVALTGLVGVASTAVMVPSRPGIADLAVDGVFNLAYMAKMALSPHEDYAHAKAEMQSFVGMNMVLIALMGAHQAKRAIDGEGFVELDPVHNALSSLALSALCMTMTGPASRLFLKSMDTMMNAGGKLASGGAAATVAARDRLSDMSDRIRQSNFVAGLQQLRPSDLITIVSQVGANAVDLLSRVGQAVVPARTSAVTITELPPEPGNPIHRT